MRKRAPRAYQPALRYLYGLQGRGIKFGLRTTRILLAVLDHPERAYPVIHVAGTNGKGSTACMLASVAREAGVRTGLYTSPHLVRFTERIRVDGRAIPERKVVRYLRLLFPTIEKTRATFFEAVTAIAFRHFADEGVGLAVIETGLGGRLDATNVVTPLVSVITSIGLDHQQYLGGTLRAIAREKAGIIKPGVPCVTGAAQPEVLAVFRRVARRRKAPLVRSSAVVSLRTIAGRPGRRRLVGRALGRIIVAPDLAGPYQDRNLRTAAAVCGILMRRRPRLLRGPGLSALRRGFSRVVWNTGLRGRFEVRGRTIFDVAHNPDGTRALVEGLQAKRLRPAAVVFGVMKDKDYRMMLRELSVLRATLVPVCPRTSRALSSLDLARAARREGLSVVSGGAVRRGMAVARRIAGGGFVLVTGSHYVVGEALAPRPTA